MWVNEKLNKKLAEYEIYVNNRKACKIKVLDEDFTPVKFTRKVGRRKTKVFTTDKYGLSKQDKLDIEVAQDYRCAICNEIKKLVVDHCHKAEEQGIMKVRGLLCASCNLMLGFAKDNVKTLKKAIQYLTEVEI